MFYGKAYHRDQFVNVDPNLCEENKNIHEKKSLNLDQIPPENENQEIEEALARYHKDRHSPYIPVSNENETAELMELPCKSNIK